MVAAISAARRSWAWTRSGASAASTRRSSVAPRWSVLDRTHVGRSIEPTAPALVTGAGPTTTTSGPADRPANSLPSETVRSTGPPRSWVSTKATFIVSDAEALAHRPDGTEVVEPTADRRLKGA